MKFYMQIQLWLFLPALLVSGCKEEVADPEAFIVCDVENVTKEKNGFYNHGHFFVGAANISTDRARSGSHSIKLDQERRYGMTTIDTSAKSGEHYEISVWRSCDEPEGTLIFSAEDKKKFYHSTGKVVEEKDGWQKLVLKVTIPPTLKGLPLKIFTWNPGGKTVYFDDLMVKKGYSKEYPAYEDIEGIELTLDQEAMSILNEKREKAFEDGILQRSANDWAKGKLNWKGADLSMKTRLKGDFLDHLQGEKWSFRVKMRKQSRWKSFRTFSLQNPAARSFLHEWVFHQWLKKEGVLTTDYGFVPVKLNGKSLGIYAYEEHFTPGLLSNNGRRPGPILKFNESGIWERHRLRKLTGRKFNAPTMDATEITAFNMDDIHRDSVSLSQFLYARNLVQDFRFGRQKFSNLINVDAAARYFAISTFCRAMHGLNWHNLRFYYDRNLQKLEFIAYDGYPEDFQVKDSAALLIGFFYDDEVNQHIREQYAFFQPFMEEEFVGKYLHYLETYCAEGYIDSLMAELKPKLGHYEGLIKREYQDYQYNRNYLFNRRDKILEDLGKFKARLQSHNLTQHIWQPEPIEEWDEQPIEGISLRAFIEEESSSGCRVKITSFHGKEIEILGGKASGLDGQFFLQTSVWLPVYDQSFPYNYQEVDFRGTVDQILFKVKGSEEIYSAPVTPWPAPPGEVIGPFQP